MFKLQELANGNILVFYANKGKLAMIISGNDKENDGVLLTAEKAKSVTRSNAGKLLTTVNTNVPLSDRYFPYISLPRVNYLDWKDGLETEETTGNIVLHELSDTNKEDVTEIVKSQESFLGLLGLQQEVPKLPAVHHAATSNGNMQCKTISRSVINEVEFSSKAGQVLASRLPNRWNDPQQLVSRYEHYCGNTRFVRGEGTYPVTYRCEDRNEDDPNSQRRLCFNSDQRLERRRCIKYGRTTSMRLLKNQCRSCSVQITRLSPAVIKYWTTQKDLVRHSPVSVNDSTVRQMKVIIERTIIIQLDDSDDETVTTMPKLFTHRSATTKINRRPPTSNPVTGNPAKFRGTMTHTKGLRQPLIDTFFKKNASHVNVTSMQDSPAKKMKLCVDISLDSTATCPPYLNGSSPTVRLPQNIWLPGQSRVGGSSCKQEKKFVDNTSNSSSEIMCL